MLEAIRLWILGEWSALFLWYAILMAALMYPRILLGLLFRFLHFCRIIHRFKHEKFSATAFVTVFDEKPEDLERCLSGLKRSLELGTNKHSLLVIIDGHGHPNPEIHASCEVSANIAAKYADIVLGTTAQNKSINLENLMKTARKHNLLHEITVLVDSDTYLEHGSVVELLLRPFSDKKIGGTTTAQRIRNPKNRIERVSDWLEDARLWSSMAAASLFRQVLCLPGRMIAVRTKLIEHRMHELAHDTFSFGPFGPWPCKAGDDRRVTNYVLEAGYGTILVPQARVTTEAKDEIGETLKMWTRWGRSSQGYTLRSPWLFKPKNWMAAFIAWGDILVTVSTVFIIAVHWPYSYLTGHTDQVFLEMIVWALAGMALTVLSRQFWHLLRHPRNLLLLPFFIFMITIGQFVRFYALCTPWLIGRWGTRGVRDGRPEAKVWMITPQFA